MTHSLNRIQSFAELLPYLEEELDWPLQQYGFDDLTFEYTPAELGLKDEDAVRIKHIHQLRPLQSGQPWGIFFVEFEQKKLPVVILRRILSHLVIKKRASANRADAAAWQVGDLLFISAYGDTVAHNREIAFAHFHQEAGDLPTLRVLGWDGGDTPLKLGHVEATLKQKLSWPDDPGDHDAWRGRWTQAFRHRVGHVIRTADALAEALAALARRIRQAALLLLSHETEQGALRTLHKAFQTALIHDLSTVDFADTYAQTITYGLLTAAISRTEMSEGVDGTVLVADNIADIVPVTNPFLKEMLQTFLQAGGRKGGINFDELGIQDVVELLRGQETDLPAVLRDFGNKTQGEDPVIHFYEHFLAAYDKKLKIQRGVFYTPKPVVSYIVRSVHELLQTEFGLVDGLADTTTWREMAQRHPDLKIPAGTDPDSPFVVILDPATGTATFLVEVIEVIYRTLTVKWQKAGLNASQRQQAWNEYAPKHLLPRLYGYELMMAPYAIAHMKMGLKLYETGYRFTSTERVRIYLTNALERPDDRLKLAGILPVLAHEAEAVNSIKMLKQFTVVLGNPPYSGHSANQMTDDWIGLRDAYYYVDGKPLGERNPKYLQDDYVKFIRFGQWRLEQSNSGILAFITNHGYLDNPTFRGMRQSLMQGFSEIHILDLHGDAKKKEVAPDGSKDENVFDIQQGVAIGIFVKQIGYKDPENINHANLWGTRINKYIQLSRQDASTTSCVNLELAHPFYLFVSQDTSWLPEYNEGQKISNLFPLHSTGIKTHRDHFALDFEQAILRQRIEDFRDISMLADEKVANQYDLHDTRDWKLAQKRRMLARDIEWESYFAQCLYRPFDIRSYYHSENIVELPRYEVMNQVRDRNNICLIANRQVRIEDVSHFFASKWLVDFHVLETAHAAVFVFPLYCYPIDSTSKQKKLLDASHWQPDEAHGMRTPNLNPAFVAKMAHKLGITFKPSTVSNLQTNFSPEDIFYYLYAIFHSPTYRIRYAEFLKMDFPRLPLTSNLDLFRALVRLGGELVALHLVEFALDNEPGLPITWSRYSRLAQFSGHDRAMTKLPSAEKAWQEERVVINSSSGFVGVPETVWNFHIGGYQVCHKWLKDRQGRTLSDADILHYCKIVTALHETIRLMAEIDEVIEQLGGWPIQ